MATFRKMLDFEPDGTPVWRLWVEFTPAMIESEDERDAVCDALVRKIKALTEMNDQLAAYNERLLTDNERLRRENETLAR
jgi:hypothetical protein